MLTRYLLTTLLLTSLTSLARAEAPAEEHAPSVLIALRVCQGNPQGTLKRGDWKVISAPQLITLYDQTAKIEIGNELRCAITPTMHKKSGKTLLDIDFASRMPVGDRTKRRITSFEIKTQLAPTPGKTVKVGGTGDGDGQVWLELTMEVIEPIDPDKVGALPKFDVEWSDNARFFQDRPRAEKKPTSLVISNKARDLMLIDASGGPMMSPVGPWSRINRMYGGSAKDALSGPYGHSLE